MDDLSLVDIKQLKRTELQRLCKQNKIKATGKNSELVSRLENLQKTGNTTLPSLIEEDTPLESPPKTKNTTLPPALIEENTCQENDKKANNKTLPSQIEGNIDDGKASSLDKNAKVAKGKSKTTKASKKNQSKKKKDVVKEEVQTPVTEGISDENFKAYVNAPSDEEPRASGSSSSQETTYCLPCVGADSVFIPGKLSEPCSSVEVSLLGNSAKTPVSSAGLYQDSKLIAKISPLMASTIEKISSRPPADVLSGHSPCHNGSYTEYTTSLAPAEEPSINQTSGGANEITLSDVSSDYETALSPSLDAFSDDQSSFATPTDVSELDLEATGNASRWLNAPHSSDNNKGNVTFAADATFVENTDGQQNVTTDPSMRRETYCIQNNKPTQAELEHRRGTFLITRPPEIDPADVSNTLGSADESSSTFDTDTPEAVEDDSNQTFTEIQPGFARSAYEPTNKLTTTAKDKRQTFVIRKDAGEENDLDCTGSAVQEDVEFEKRSSSSQDSSTTDQGKKNGEKTAVHFCGCHGLIRKSSDWRQLVLIKCMVFVQSPSGNPVRFELNPSGRFPPIGWKDNMICGDCVEENTKQTKSKMDPSTLKSIAQKPSSKKELDKGVGKSTHTGNKRKRELEEKENTNIYSPYKRRCKELTTDNGNVKSPGSPQVRRARGEKLELSKKLLEPWKPTRKSIDPSERREDVAYAKKVEEIMRSVEPGSREEMALVMDKKSKLNSN